MTALDLHHDRNQHARVGEPDVFWKREHLSERHSLAVGIESFEWTRELSTGAKHKGATGPEVEVGRGKALWISSDGERFSDETGDQDPVVEEDGSSRQGPGQ